MIIYDLMFILLCGCQEVIFLKGMDEILLFPDIGHNLKILGISITFSLPCYYRLFPSSNLFNSWQTQKPKLKIGQKVTFSRLQVSVLLCWFKMVYYISANYHCYFCLGRRDLGQCFRALAVLHSLVCRTLRGFRLGWTYLSPTCETTSVKPGISVQKNSNLNLGLKAGIWSGVRRRGNDQMLRMKYPVDVACHEGAPTVLNRKLDQF
jgi:hypothetical protein